MILIKQCNNRRFCVSEIHNLNFSKSAVSRNEHINVQGNWRCYIKGERWHSKIQYGLLCFLSAPHLWRGVTRKWRTSESSAGVDAASALLQRCRVQSRSHYLCISSLLFREMKIREKSKHMSGNRPLLSFVLLVSGPDTSKTLNAWTSNTIIITKGKTNFSLCVRKSLTAIATNRSDQLLKKTLYTGSAKQNLGQNRINRLKVVAF